MTALEADLRGEVALAIMALLTWAEFHGGITPLIDGTISKWLTAGRPDDPGIARALVKLRNLLARYVARGGAVPIWFPPSLAALLEPAAEIVDQPWAEAGRHRDK